MTVTSLLILERGFQGLKTHCRAAGGGRKGVSCTGSLPCTHWGRKHPRAALLGHSGFAAISWHARTLFPQTSLGKLLVHTSTQDYHPKPLVFAAFLPPAAMLPSAPSSSEEHSHQRSPAGCCKPHAVPRQGCHLSRCLPQPHMAREGGEDSVGKGPSGISQQRQSKSNL